MPADGNTVYGVSLIRFRSLVLRPKKMSRSVAHIKCAILALALVLCASGGSVLAQQDDHPGTSTTHHDGMTSAARILRISNHSLFPDFGNLLSASPAVQATSVDGKTGSNNSRVYLPYEYAAPTGVGWFVYVGSPLSPHYADFGMFSGGIYTSRYNICGGYFGFPWDEVPGAAAGVSPVLQEDGYEILSTSYGPHDDEDYPQFLPPYPLASSYYLPPAALREEHNDPGYSVYSSKGSLRSEAPSQGGLSPEFTDVASKAVASRTESSGGLEIKGDEDYLSVPPSFSTSRTPLRPALPREENDSGKSSKYVALPQPPLNLKGDEDYYLQALHFFSSPQLPPHTATPREDIMTTIPATLDRVPRNSRILRLHPRAAYPRGSSML